MNKEPIEEHPYLIKVAVGSTKEGMGWWSWAYAFGKVLSGSLRKARHLTGMLSLFRVTGIALGRTMDVLVPGFYSGVP